MYLFGDFTPKRKFDSSYPNNKRIDNSFLPEYIQTKFTLSQPALSTKINSTAPFNLKKKKSILRKEY